MTHVADSQKIEQATREPVPRPAGWPTLVYAVSVYLLFAAALCYAVGFFADIAVPKGIDGGATGPAPVAAAVDVLLLSLFAVQHTVMARPWFKRGWTRLVPVAADRRIGVACARPGRMGAAGHLRGWLADRHRLNVPDQPPRPVRGAAGVPACPRQGIPPSPVRPARPLPAYSAFFHGRIRGHLLGGALHDHRAPAVRRRRDRLHPGWHQVRGT